MSQRIAYSYDGAAEQFEVSKDMIRRAVEKGELSPRYIGRLPRIKHDDLAEWFDSLPEEYDSSRR